MRGSSTRRRGARRRCRSTFNKSGASRGGAGPSIGGWAARRLRPAILWIRRRRAWRSLTSSAIPGRRVLLGCFWGICGKSLRHAPAKRTIRIAELTPKRNRRAATPRTQCNWNRVQAPCARSASREGMSTGTGPGTLAHRTVPVSPPRATANTSRIGMRTRRARTARTPRSREAATAPTPRDEPPADRCNRSARIPTDECSRIPARRPTPDACPIGDHARDVPSMTTSKRSSAPATTI